MLRKREIENRAQSAKNKLKEAAKNKQMTIQYTMLKMKFQSNNEKGRIYIEKC